MKIFLDTNFLLRYYLKDDQRQFENCKELILQIEEGKFKVYTSSIVFLEVSYVLKSVYKLLFSDITEVLDSILTIRGITIIDKTNVKIALEFYKKYKVKFTDCLIASQLPKNTILVSFDEELSKIKEIEVKSPLEFH